MTGLFIFFVCLVSGFVQAASSFGYAMVAMLAISLVFPVKEASVIILLTSIPTYIILFYYIFGKKRIKIKVKYFIYPLLGTLAGRLIGVDLFQRLSDKMLLNIFCIFMLAINLYFWTVMGKLEIKPSKINGAAAGLIGGIFGSMYNISGPPIVAYYQAAEQDKYVRMGYQEIIFVVGSAITASLHYYNGNIKSSLLWICLAGTCGTVIGVIIGFKTYEKLKVEQLRFIIRVFILVFSIVLTINTFSSGL